jgi:hypothetical protein
MNTVLMCGQFLTTDHCSLSTGRVPPLPPKKINKVVESLQIIMNLHGINNFRIETP